MQKHRCEYTAPVQEIYFLSRLFGGILAALFIEHNIRDDAENKSTSDRGDRNLAEGYGQAANTGNKDNGDDKEVSVILKINLLYHLKSADRDKAVERDADAAHDAGGDRREKGCKR